MSPELKVSNEVIHCQWLLQSELFSRCLWRELEEVKGALMALSSLALLAVPSYTEPR